MNRIILEKLSTVRYSDQLVTDKSMSYSNPVAFLPSWQVMDDV